MLLKRNDKVVIDKNKPQLLSRFLLFIIIFAAYTSKKFFNHLFFNKCIFVQFIHLHGQTVPITNTAEKQHDILVVLIGDDAVAQSISLILSREGKKRKTLPSFFLSLQYTHKMFFLIFPSFQVSLVYRRKKTHNMDRWEKSTQTHCFFLLRTIILWCGGTVGLALTATAPNVTIPAIA